MKLAYVSFVLHNLESISWENLNKLDKILSDVCQSHEIVIVLPFSNQSHVELMESQLNNRGPITFVLTVENESNQSSMISGLGRAVGDFVIDWHQDLNTLDSAAINYLLNRSDQGVELIEIVSPEKSRLNRLFFSSLNRFRATTFLINNSAGRIFSRRALQLFLTASKFEKYSELVLAELPVRREVLFLSGEASKKRLGLRKIFALLTRGTNLGINFPIFVSIIFGSFAVFASIYALCIFAFRGRTPEGWVTLMVLLGLSQAVVLLLLGMLWNQFKTLTDTLFKDKNITVDVKVHTPKNLNP